MANANIVAVSPTIYLLSFNDLGEVCYRGNDADPTAATLRSRQGGHLDLVSSGIW